MRKILLIIFLLCVLTLSSLHSQTATQLTLNLKRVVTINDQNIKVSDLVDTWEGNPVDMLKIQNIVVEELPYQRRMMNIPSNTVARKIRQRYPDLEFSIPSVVTAVRWEDVILGESRIKSAAEEYLRDYFNLTENAEISFNNIPRINIPSDRVDLSFEMSRTTENTSFVRLDGTATLNGEILSVFNILARVSEQQLVYQANKTIRKGQTITPDDFSIVMITVNPNHNYLRPSQPTLRDSSLDTPYEAISELGEVEGDIIANNLISRGSYLRATDVVNTPFVSRNSLVTVLIRSASMQMSYEAVSRADGWLGDRILLQNPDSMQNFYAVVVDKNIAMINLED